MSKFVVPRGFIDSWNLRFKFSIKTRVPNDELTSGLQQTTQAMENARSGAEVMKCVHTKDRIEAAIQKRASSRISRQK